MYTSTSTQAQASLCYTSDLLRIGVAQQHSTADMATKLRYALPVEDWERIIDLAGVASGDDPITYYSTIRTCCLVCHSWLPRSRYNLYHTLRITDKVLESGSSPAYCLTRVLLATPVLASLVTELQVALRDPDSGRLISLSSALGPTSWLQSLSCLRRVTLLNIAWRYPRLYRATISSIRQLSHFILHWVSFDTTSDLFRLVWSLPCLTSLVLHQVSFIRRIGAAEYARLCSICPNRASIQLEELSISVRHSYTPRLPIFTHLGTGRSRRSTAVPTVKPVWRGFTHSVP